MEQQQEEEEDEGVGRRHVKKLRADPQLKKKRPPEVDLTCGARAEGAALQREMRADGAAAGFRSPSFNAL